MFTYGGLNVFVFVVFVRLLVILLVVLTLRFRVVVVFEVIFRDFDDFKDDDVSDLLMERVSLRNMICVCVCGETVSPPNSVTI